MYNIKQLKCHQFCPFVLKKSNYCAGVTKNFVLMAVNQPISKNALANIFAVHNLTYKRKQDRKKCMKCIYIKG